MTRTSSCEDLASTAIDTVDFFNSLLLNDVSALELITSRNALNKGNDSFDSALLNFSQVSNNMEKKVKKEMKSVMETWEENVLHCVNVKGKEWMKATSNEFNRKLGRTNYLFGKTDEMITEVTKLFK